MTESRQQKEHAATRKEIRDLGQKQENEEVRRELRDLVHTVDSFISQTKDYMSKMDKYQDALIVALTNNTPSGHIPINTHNMVVRGLLWAFTVVVLVAIGSVKMLPAVLQAVGLPQ